MGYQTSKDAETKERLALFWDWLRSAGGMGASFWEVQGSEDSRHLLVTQNDVDIGIKKEYVGSQKDSECSACANVASEYDQRVIFSRILVVGSVLALRVNDGHGDG